MTCLTQRSVASSYTERHVGFALNDGRGEQDEEDVGEEGDGDDVDGSRRPQRLHRRDTPHHLKNKRINLNKVDEERAADLIAQVCSLLLQLIYLLFLIKTRWTM